MFFLPATPASAAQILLHRSPPPPPTQTAAATPQTTPAASAKRPALQCAREIPRSACSVYPHSEPRASIARLQAHPTRTTGTSADALQTRAFLLDSAPRPRTLQFFRAISRTPFLRSSAISA